MNNAIKKEIVSKCIYEVLKILFPLLLFIYPIASNTASPFELYYIGFCTLIIFSIIIKSIIKYRKIIKSDLKEG